jgi:hypothetical protein
MKGATSNPNAVLNVRLDLRMLAANVDPAVDLIGANSK